MDGWVGGWMVFQYKPIFKVLPYKFKSQLAVENLDLRFDTDYSTLRYYYQEERPCTWRMGPLLTANRGT